MVPIRILFTRFSAFYSPLIAAIACGMLEEEGLQPEYRVETPAKSARAEIEDGTCHLAQSAVWSSWASLETGKASPIVHFAQLNRTDGFFLIGKEPDLDFTWNRLAGKRVLVDHGTQPLATFKYAAYRMDVATDAIEAVDLGGSEAMDAAFRSGRADFVHLQGPAAQQLEADGVGHIVAGVGEAVGPIAFSSLAATRDWLQTDMAAAFMRAYRKARAFVTGTPPADVAHALRDCFGSTGEDVLARTIAYYQGLGAWHPAVEIDRHSYESALDVFLHNRLITTRHPFDAVVVPPPGA